MAQSLATARFGHFLVKIFAAYAPQCRLVWLDQPVFLCHLSAMIDQFGDHLLVAWDALMAL